jgi:hypothetical protein
MTKRKLKVGYLNRESRSRGCNGIGTGWIRRDLLARPKLVLANRFLQNAGFNIGDNVEVLFEDRKIVISKI